MTESDLTRLRALAASEPGRHTADLAAALRTLGWQRAESGEYDAGVVAVTEAVALYRRLAADDAPTFEPELAAALLALGNLHSDIGDWASARAALAESVERFRPLAEPDSDPDLGHLYWLGAALDYLGIAQGALGEHEAALAVTEESVRIYEWMNYEIPVDLAEALTNLSDRQAAIGDDDALNTAYGASRLYRQMVVEHADRVRADYAAFLSVFSRRFAEAGDLEAALFPARQSVVLFRELDADQARTHRPKYAEALLTFASVGHAVCVEADELDIEAEVAVDEVLAAAREAVEIYRDLAQRAPRRYLDRLAEAESLVDSPRLTVTDS